MRYVIIAIIAYLIGNISFAVLISKYGKKDDVRKHGSGNAGATNMVRAYGFKMGIVTFVGDMLKGLVATYLGYVIGGQLGMYIAAVLVVIGHDFPVFFKFKGGKGVSTTIGAMFFIAPFSVLICFIIGISIAIFTRTVSLGSLIGVCLSPIAILIFMKPLDMNSLYLALVLVALVIFRHKENIKRLIKGEEHKL